MINILLSSYNGEQYIGEQIDSILSQSLPGFQLIIRDDGSTDKTLNIINSYINKHPDKIQLLQDDKGNLGPGHSFLELMKNSSAKYYMFADQDDVWHKNKVEVLLENISKQNNNIPQLYGCNLNFYYENKSTESFNYFKKFKITNEKVSHGLHYPFIPGCSMIFNDSCKIKAIQLFDYFNDLHDIIVTKSAFFYGEVRIIDDILIDHRIHNNNVIGLKSSKETILISIKDIFKYLFKSKVYRETLMKEYFKDVENFRILDNNLRLNKFWFSNEELSNKTFVYRKAWYIKHFNPFQKPISTALKNILLF